MASTTRRKIDQILADARKDLEAQLELVRVEKTRLAAEEQELTAAIAGLETNGGGSPPVARRRQRAAATRSTKAGTRSSGGAKGRRKRTANKPTAQRLDELRALLTEGPKSRGDIATALKLSPARVQQLLGELGTAVTSQPANDGRAKLWSIKGARNGASAARSRPARGRARAKGSSVRK